PSALVLPHPDAVDLVVGGEAGHEGPNADRVVGPEDPGRVGAVDAGGDAAPHGARQRLVALGGEEPVGQVAVPAVDVDVGSDAALVDDVVRRVPQVPPVGVAPGGVAGAGPEGDAVRGVGHEGVGAAVVHDDALDDDALGRAAAVVPVEGVAALDAGGLVPVVGLVGAEVPQLDPADARRPEVGRRVHLLGQADDVRAAVWRALD